MSLKPFEGSVEEARPDLLNHLADYTGYIYWLIDTQNLWSEDGFYAFPNGDIWSKKDYEQFKLVGL